MTSPRTATPIGATTSAIQKLPIPFAALARRYAPTANSAPWAKLGMFSTPVIRARPSPIRAYSIPVAIPLRIWARRNLRTEPWRSAWLSNLPDVLAGLVLLRQRRVAGGDDVREVHRVLHRRLRLAAHEEVRAEVLVRLRFHLHRPDDVVELDPFHRLDHILYLGRFRLVDTGEQQARHRVRRRRSVARRVAKLRLVALHELLRHRCIGGVVEVGADPDVLPYL